MDIDLWIMPNPENAVLVLQALEDFGTPSGNLSREDLQKEDIIFQIGAAPRRIDILTSIDGLIFEEAFANSQTIEIDGIPVQVLSITDLIRNKRAAGRTKDLADAESLEELG
jgi:predicted nucleotidyltransferase